MAFSIVKIITLMLAASPAIRAGPVPRPSDGILDQTDAELLKFPSASAQLARLSGHYEGPTGFTQRHVRVQAAAYPKGSLKPILNEDYKLDPPTVTVVADPERKPLKGVGSDVEHSQHHLFRRHDWYQRVYGPGAEPYGRVVQEEEYRRAQRMAALFPEMTATVNNDEVDTPEEIDTPEEKLDTWRHDESPENINTDSPYWSAECPIHGINCYDKPLNLSDPAVLDYYIKLADSRQGKPYPVTPEAVCEWICRQPRPAQLPKDRYYAVDGIDRRPPYDGRVHPDGWHPNCCLHGSDAKHITGPRKLVRRGSTDGELDEDKLIELIRQFLLKAQNKPQDDQTLPEPVIKDDISLITSAEPPAYRLDTWSIMIRQDKDGQVQDWSGGFGGGMLQHSQDSLVNVGFYPDSDVPDDHGIDTHVSYEYDHEDHTPVHNEYHEGVDTPDYDEYHDEYPHEDYIEVHDEHHHDIDTYDYNEYYNEYNHEDHVVNDLSKEESKDQLNAITEQHGDNHSQDRVSQSEPNNRGYEEGYAKFKAAYEGILPFIEHMAANSLYAYIPEDRGAEEMLGPDVFKVDYVDPDVGETLHVTYAPIWRLYPDTGKVSEEDRTEYPIDQPSYLVDVKDQVTGNVIQLDVVSTKQFDRLAKRIQYNIYGPDAPYGMSRDFDDIQEETLNEETYETPIEELKSTDRSPSTRTSKDGNTFTTAVSETTDIGIAKIHIPTDLNATAVLSVQASAREVNDDDEAKPIGVPPGEVLVFRNKGGTLFCPTIEIPEGIIMDRSAIDVTIRPCVYSVNVNFPEAIDVRKTIKDPKPKAPLFSLVNILGGDDRDDGVFNDYTRHVRRDGTVPITKKKCLRKRGIPSKVPSKYESMAAKAQQMQPQAPGITRPPKSNSNSFPTNLKKIPPGYKSPTGPSKTSKTQTPFDSKKGVTGSRVPGNPMYGVDGKRVGFKDPIGADAVRKLALKGPLPKSVVPGKKYRDQRLNPTGKDNYY